MCNTETEFLNKFSSLEEIFLLGSVLSIILMASFFLGLRIRSEKSKLRRSTG
jgi:hypothetical protein